MSHQRRVEMDSAAPERVPPLSGDAEVDYLDGAPADSSRLLMDRFDSVIDSGMDSLISGSLHSDSSALAGELSNLTVQDTTTTTTQSTSGHTVTTSESQTLSQTLITEQSERTISIDEAYHSSDAYFSGGLEEVQRRQREIKAAYTQDEDGDT